MPEGDDRAPFQKFADGVFSIVDGPVTYFREKFVDPMRSKNKQYYYHRRFRRVPTIDECDDGDEVCTFEANEQYKRDKLVDGEVVKILRQRRIECEHYYGATEAPKKCTKEVEDYEQASTDFFIKYGDMGALPNVREAYMKQKHRLIWERRHGPVGTGMNAQEQ